MIFNGRNDRKSGEDVNVSEQVGLSVRPAFLVLRQDKNAGEIRGDFDA